MFGLTVLCRVRGMFGYFTHSSNRKFRVEGSCVQEGSRVVYTHTNTHTPVCMCTHVWLCVCDWILCYCVSVLMAAYSCAAAKS